MLILHKDSLQEIYAHCDGAYPNEACGILAGRDGRVETVYPMTNAEPSPSFYLIDAQEQFRVMKQMRQAGEDLVGIYHSHTGSPAYPSATDVSLAYYPEAHYLIVTLMDRAHPAARAYSIVDGAIAEVEVRIHSEEYR
ncbi:MAG TPA: peptidase [Nitrospiraceae bacterium]|nr:peptidase [Nitrospiraceae bacterium]